MFNEKINPLKYEPKFKKDNYSKIANFNCGNDDINNLFRKKLDKIHATTFLFLDKEKDNKIIAFISFCTASIQMQQKGLNLYPAIELKLFGVDKDYQHKTVVLHDEELKYSELTFKWLISYIQYSIKDVVYTEYLILHSIPNDNTLKFYEKMGLEYLGENQNVFNSDFSDGCIPMYLKL